jgi:hypothetical protein
MHIRLEQELQGHQAAAALAGEEGTFLVMCYALLRICAKSDSLLVTLHTEGEGINLDDYYGKDEENIDDDNDDGINNEGDYEEMNRKPAPLAAGHAGRAPAPPARSSPTRPVAPAAAAAANVDQLADNLSHVDLGALVFNFQARYPQIFVPTPSLASG